MALRDDVERESARWVEAGIIDQDQRARILALYPEGEGGPSMGVLAILWTGGALLFLGIAFLLGILWDDLGPLRVVATLALDAAFFGGGAWLLVRRRELERTAMALLVIGGLLLPPALGLAYEDIVGSSGHPLPLVVLCGAVYAALALRLRSHAFSVLFVAALFVMGEEVVRDDDRFGFFFPLVQLGLVSELSDVFPLVFYSQAALVTLLAFLAGRTETHSHLRPTLWVCALLLALLPGLVGCFQQKYEHLHVALALLASLGGMGISVALRERRAFWVAGAGLVGALLVLFGKFFEDSVAFTCFAIVLGALILAGGTWLATQKRSWLDRLFGDDSAPGA